MSGDRLVHRRHSHAHADRSGSHRDANPDGPANACLRDSEPALTQPIGDLAANPSRYDDRHRYSSCYGDTYGIGISYAYGNSNAHPNVIAYGNGSAFGNSNTDANIRVPFLLLDRDSFE